MAEPGGYLVTEVPPARVERGQAAALQPFGDVAIVDPDRL